MIKLTDAERANIAAALRPLLPPVGLEAIPRDGVIEAVLRAVETAVEPRLADHHISRVEAERIAGAGSMWDERGRGWDVVVSAFKVASIIVDD